MKIGIGNDTAGTTLKYIILEHLKAKGFEVIDFGAASGETVEYPTAAKTVSEAVLTGQTHE
jgi:ribose-5-phosphate isomerase B (fragment)